jgi:hypothetical protein
VLEAEAIRGLESEEAGEEGERQQPERRDEGGRYRGEQTGEHQCDAQRELPTRHRAKPFQRMEPVVGSVAEVVDEVGRARGRAVGREGDACLGPSAAGLRPRRRR